MVEMVRDALSTSMDQPHPPTTVFCSREHYASAIVEACAGLSISVPDQLRIVAFVDRPSYLFQLPESVIRIRQDVALMGKVAADRVLRRLNGEKLPLECILVPALNSSHSASLEAESAEAVVR
jgi:DNA-binding LacI/PurR family transcriptional regulator